MSLPQTHQHNIAINITVGWSAARSMENIQMITDTRFLVSFEH